MITLQNFIQGEQVRLAAFKRWWKNQPNNELFPPKMPSGEWDEQYEFFDENDVDVPVSSSFEPFFADTTDEDLKQICSEYDSWRETAYVPDDAILRQKAEELSQGNVIFGITTVALGAYRELCKRMELYE